MWRRPEAGATGIPGAAAAPGNAVTSLRSKITWSEHTEPLLSSFSPISDPSSLSSLLSSPPSFPPPHWLHTLFFFCVFISPLFFLIISTSPCSLSLLFFYHILESFFNFPLSSSFYCPTFSCPPPSPSSSHLSACSFLLPLLSPSRSPACCFKLDSYLFAQLKQYMDSIEDLQYKNFVLVSACSLSGSRSVSPSG